MIYVKIHTLHAAGELMHMIEEGIHVIKYNVLSGTYMRGKVPIDAPEDFKTYVERIFYDTIDPSHTLGIQIECDTTGLSFLKSLNMEKSLLVELLHYGAKVYRKKLKVLRMNQL